jgi:hypothetical protein
MKRLGLLASVLTVLGVQGLELREWHERQGTSALRSGSTQASLPMS